MISAIAVIILHTNGCFWNFSRTERYWKTANIIESVFYFAVPVFFMVSGATLLDFYKRYGLKEYFSKRIIKTVVPYIVWSILGLLFRIFYLGHMEFADIGVSYVINGLLGGNIISIYWFFIPLFCIYLCIPLFAAVSDELRKVVFSYIAVACFIFNYFIPFVINVLELDIHFSISVTVGTNYLFYVVIGYLLNKYELSTKSRYVIYGFGIIGLLMHIVGTYNLSMREGWIVQTYKGYANVPCILWSVGVFVFFKYTGGRIMGNKVVAKVINVLKKYTFSIYLTHWYVMQMLVYEFGADTKSIIYRLGAPFLIVIVVVICTWLVRRIPLVRRILP